MSRQNGENFDGVGLWCKMQVIDYWQTSAHAEMTNAATRN